MAIGKSGSLITLKVRDLQGILQSSNGVNNLFSYEEGVTVEQFVKDASDRFKTPAGQFELVYQDLKRGEIYELSKLPQQEPLSMINITPSREKEYPFTVEKRKGLVAISKSTASDTSDLLELSKGVVISHDVENVTLERKKFTRFNSAPVDEVFSCGREFVGLKNMTMTCYLNSLIQTLFFTPEFRNALYSYNAENKEKSENKSIALALQKLFLHMQFSVRSSVETDDLTKTFGWRDNEVWMQQDVEELYRLLMDYLTEELKGTMLDGVMPSLFGGLLNDYVECTECHKRNCKEELFLAVPLPVRVFGKPLNAPTLEEALQAFVAPEILDGNNQYRCEPCGKPCDAKKGLSFKKFPYILTITLNRFEFNWRSLTKHKLNDEVVFPMTLDMNKMLDPETVNATSDNSRVPELQPHLFKLDRPEAQKVVHSRPSIDLAKILQAKPEKTPAVQQKPEATEDQKVPEEAAGETRNPEAPSTSGPNVYQLYAILIHRGGVNGGHYYAYIKDIESGQWYRCDDTSVRRISEEEITKTYGGYDLMTDASSEGGVAYILVYRRKDPVLNSLPITYEMLPPHIKTMWDSMKEADQKCYEREELERNTIKLSVGTRTEGQLEIQNLKEMVIDRSASLQEAAMQCYKEFYPEGPEIPNDCVRLIRGDKNLNIIENSFEGKEDEIICIAVKRPMPITDAEGFLLQVKKPEESFEVYSQSDIVIFAHHVADDRDQVERSIEVHVPSSATIAQARAKVLEKLGLPEAAVVGVYGNNEPGRALPVKTLIAEADEGFVGTLKIAKIANVYVRRTLSEAAMKEFVTLATFWVTSFEVIVKVSGSLDSSAEQIAESKHTYRYQVIQDKMEDLERELKLQLAKGISLQETSSILCKLIGVEEPKFILSKSYEGTTVELLDFLEENEKLEECMPFDEIKCTMGQRLKAAEGRVSVFLLDMQNYEAQSEPQTPRSAVLNPEMLGTEVKALFAELLGIPSEDVKNFIVRRKIPKGPSRILRDDETVGSVARRLHESEFYLQKVSVPEDCAEGYHSLFIRRWNMDTSTLGRPEEVFIPQDYTLPAHELVMAKLSEVLELPSEKFQVSNPENHGTFPYTLDNETVSSKLHWFSIITRPRSIYIYNDELFLFVRTKPDNLPPEVESSKAVEDDNEDDLPLRSARKETGVVINLARSPPS